MCRAKGDLTCPAGRQCKDSRRTTEAGRLAHNARMREIYAAKKLAKTGKAVRPYGATAQSTPVEQPKQQQPAEITTHPMHATVRVQGEWAVEFSTDPKAVRQRELAAQRIGADRRDAQGRIIWARVTEPELRACRSSVERNAPAARRIPAGALTADGQITKAAREQLRPDLVRELEELVRRTSDDHDAAGRPAGMRSTFQP